MKKFAQILEKVAKTVDKPKKYEIIFFPKQSKTLHENTSKLLKYLKITLSPLKNSPGPLNNSPNDEILPNLPTLALVEG